MVHKIPLRNEDFPQSIQLNVATIVDYAYMGSLFFFGSGMAFYIIQILYKSC